MDENATATVRFIGRKEEDAQQISWMLSNAVNANFSFEHVSCLESFIEAGHGRNDDVIILDITETSDSRLDAISTLSAKIPQTPVVVLTDDDEKVGREAIRQGAQDYLIKSQLTTDGMSRNLLNAIQRHRGHQRSAEAAPLLDSATAVLNRLPIGVILVTADSRILFFNDKAKRYLEQGDGLVVGTDKICRATLPGESRALAKLLSDTLSPDEKAKAEGDFAISITRMESDYPLNVMVAPIGTGVAGKGAVLFVSDPAEPVELSIDSICRLYGLTPAEGRLALGLTNGDKLDDLAEQWGVSMHTVRSQLRQIFRKTDTSRQSEVVKLILTGPAALQASVSR
ncbi:DNA-binding response regulator [uncultured Sneathiella sp.]|uniref:DNA-binding response regulator n=1 Tax=uncultured Sneathiella sp. TaxID=879315 RepID=UPI0030ECFC7F|tara:strand:- start:38864 stop:39886 length:1023 start_codon:yes stop_codon:yes gene_type:complete